jgi:hypothetical protein
VLGWWAVSQVAALFVAPSEKVGVWAHIGGFVLDVLLIFVMRPRAGGAHILIRGRGQRSRRSRRRWRPTATSGIALVWFK